MVKLKQYLENSWYRWASQDRQTWYAAQFQYGENINVRDMKNGVCLSWWATDLDTHGEKFSYFNYEWWLYIVDREWKVYEITESWIEDTPEWDIWESLTLMPIWIQFWDWAYIVCDEWIFELASWWTYTDVTPAGFWWNVTCALNYANTYLLVWDWNMVWRFSRASWTMVWKVVREFDTGLVFWLTQEWNYLKIYVNDSEWTKIHYAKGTFDVEDTWLIQTVSFKWLWINYKWVASDQWNDYVAFIPTYWEIKLAKVSWYNKTDIRWTQTWWWEKVFWWTPKVFASDWVVFAVANEWIWTFTEYNGWLWWWCVEFKETREILDMIRVWERLYVCIKDWNSSYILRYYDLSFHPATYQSSGFIIGRVFDWWCAGLFKKNDQATITYNMPAGTGMELSYRYDRETFWYNKNNFISIKKLTDVNSCYDIVVPTTPSNTDEYVLLKEDWDKILLENWNWIKLEDNLVCPFNKTWNLLEYRVDLNTTNTSKTPILFEHSLTYYDYMRKYR